MVSTNDIESQINDDPQPQPPIDNDPPPTNTPNSRPPTSADPMPQVANTNERHNGNPPASQTADNPGPAVQRDENHGDSSDGLWSIYLTEAEKQDNEVTESWKGDTEGILVFTGLFSATVAAFIIESYKLLSPNSGDTTNALLAQISGQLVNISNGTPLTGVAAQSSLPFKPTASAVKVNVLWFLSLILSLNCALSATLMQQWARRYRELAQRRGATHRRGRMRAYIFDGLNRFGMAQAVATMPRLLHISVFLFFAGLIEFLFPIYTTVAYATLGCIVAFALAYAILTVLPNIFLNCPYGTPLSGYTWRISHFSIFVFLRTILEICKSLSKMWSLANRRAHQSDGLRKWRKRLEEQVNVHRQLFWQGLRKSVELSAYRANSIVVTGALEWTLTALDEDKEIEDFAAQVPGFFNSRAVPDATSAVLPLMSHEPTTDPVFGSRLYDLLKTCIPETSVLDENTRKNRLRICLNCLWYFGRAYNQSGISQPLPSYFRNSLIPEVVRRVQTEEDSGVRVIGHCFEALIINMFVADINSRTNPISNGELVLLSTILNTGSHDVKLLLRQPGAIALANMISFISDKVGTLVADTIPSDVLDVVQQTLGILSQSQSLLAHESADSELQLDQPIAMIDVSKRNFEHILLSRLHDLLNTCIPATSPLPEEVHASCLQMCLKGLWYFARAFNRPENSMPLPPNIYITLSNPEMIRHIREQRNPTFRVIGCCVMGLVLSKLAADINSRTVPVSDVELASLSSILGSESRGVRVCLTQPGVVGLINMVSITLHPSFLKAKEVPLDARDVFQQTLEILYQALPAQENDELRPDQAIALSNISDNRFEHAIVSRLHSFLKTCIPGASPLTEEVRTSCLHLSLKALWHSAKAYHDTYNPLPPYFPIILASPEIAHHFQTERDPVARLTGCCLGALIVSKLVDALKSPFSLGGHVDNAELACISAILGKGHYGKLLWPRQILVINLQNIVSLMSREVDILFTTEGTPGDMLDIAQDTLYILASSLRRIGFEGVPMDQWGLLLGIPAEVLNIRVEVLNAVDSDLDRLKDQTMKRLDRLQQVLEKL